MIVLLFGDFSLSKGNSANQAHFCSKDIHSRGAPLWLHTYSLVPRPGPRSKVTITLYTVYTHPQDGFVAGVASLSEGLLVAALTEDLFLLKHKGGVVQLLVASVAGEVLRVPHSAHCTRKWATACV